MGVRAHAAAVGLFTAIPRMMMHRSTLDHARDEAAVRGVEQVYDAAWNRGDVEVLIALFQDEAVIVNPRGQTARGRAEIEQVMRQFLAGPAARSTHTSVIRQVHFLGDEVAIVDGEATLNGIIGPDGGTEPPLVHQFTDVLTRTRDTWLIAHVRAYVLMPESAYQTARFRQ
jgi:uncharacterized protein (TIGR02246 family)